MTNEVLQKIASDEQNISSSNGLEPSLRFGHFVGNWEKSKLSSLFKKCLEKNKNGLVDNVICNSAKNGLMPQRDFFDKDIANTENTNGYYIIQENDFVYNPRKSNEAPYGPISMYKYKDKGIVSPLYLCFRATKEIHPRYFEMYFKSSVWHKYIYFAGDSGARYDRVSIKDDVFFEMPINIPSLPEQQKIADFLSLVDRRIEKQRQLVESLKKYKRGALSRVFNDVLETVKLSDISNFISSARTLSTTLNGNKGIYPVYDAAGIAGYIDYYDIDSDYITIVKDGSGVGRLQKCDKKSSFIGTLGALVAKNCTTDFLYAVLQTIDFSKFVTGMAIPHIYYRDYKSTLLPFPSEEKQHFISQLLKKFDIYIENETQKLTNMLAYKQGLLQQMFI